MQSDIGTSTNQSSNTLTGICSRGTYRNNRPEGHDGGGSYDVSVNASHGHTVTINSNGSNSAHNNVQPYITAYIFRRTA